MTKTDVLQRSHLVSKGYFPEGFLSVAEMMKNYKKNGRLNNKVTPNFWFYG